MTLTGKDALEFYEKLKQKQEKEEAEELERARREAAERGKEPFDLDKLEQLCDTSSEGRVDAVERRHANFEYMYYVSKPEIMSLAELAAYIERTNKA